MFLEDLTMLCFDSNGSNSIQESSPNKESNVSSDDFSANLVQVRNGSKRSVSCPHGPRRGVRTRAPD